MRWDGEMEAIWLATANSDLRSEQRELKAKIERLEAENFRLEAENDQCVRTLNQYMEAVQQMVTLLAEKDAEIERLRAAGDLLAEDLGDNPWADRLIAAWEEARRER